VRKKLSLGDDVVAYLYRHSYVTDALENGVGLAQVCELVGHVNTDMVMRHYAHLNQRREHLRERRCWQRRSCALPLPFHRTEAESGQEQVRPKPHKRPGASATNLAARRSVPLASVDLGRERLQLQVLQLHGLFGSRIGLNATARLKFSRASSGMRSTPRRMPTRMWRRRAPSTRRTRVRRTLQDVWQLLLR